MALAAALDETRAGKRGNWTGPFTTNVDSGTVSVLDLADRRLVGVIEVASSVQRISVSRDGRQISTHDQALPRLAVIDALAVKLAGGIDLPGRAYASRAATDGRPFIVAPWGDGAFSQACNIPGWLGSPLIGMTGF